MEHGQYRLVASEDDALTATKWLRLVRDNDMSFIRLSMERTGGTAEGEREISDDEDSGSEEVSKP